MRVRAVSVRTNRYEVIQSKGFETQAGVTLAESDAPCTPT